LSNTTVYAPYIRALLGTVSHFCKVVVPMMGLVVVPMMGLAVVPMMGYDGLGSCSYDGQRVVLSPRRRIVDLGPARLAIQHLHVVLGSGYRDTSLTRHNHPHRITMGPQA
jgi:hypothetical protein